jgi:hypothetical protein
MARNTSRMLVISGALYKRENLNTADMKNGYEPFRT